MNGEIRRLQDRRRALTYLWDTQFNAGQWEEADRTMAAIRDLTRLIGDLIWEISEQPLARAQVLEAPVDA